jgi:hypothetical protein
VTGANGSTCQPCGNRDQRCCSPFVFGGMGPGGGSCVTPLNCNFNGLTGVCGDPPPATDPGGPIGPFPPGGRIP